MPVAVRDDDADPVAERVAVLEPEPDSAAVAVHVEGAEREWVGLPDTEREARMAVVPDPDAVAVFVLDELVVIVRLVLGVRVRTPVALPLRVARLLADTEADAE